MEMRAYSKRSPISGNGLYAKEFIGPGQQILSIPRPLIAVLGPPIIEQACSNCFANPNNRTLPDVQFKVSACTGCKTVKYCSKKCQSGSWKGHHKYECKFLATHRDDAQGLWTIARGVMQLVFMKSAAIINEDLWKQIMNLEGHLDTIRLYGTGERWQAIAQMSHVLESDIRKALPDIESIDFIYKLFTIFTINSLTLISSTFEPLGMVFDPLVALANHSCDPNAVVVMDGPQLSFRSIRPIQKDEEILISYIENSDPFSKRQQELEFRYYFTCACSKCQHGPTGIEDKLNQEANQLNKDWQKVADSLMKADKFMLDPAYAVAANGIDSKRLHALQQRAYQLLEQASTTPNPTLATGMLEEGLKICHESQMWPMYRQPYPALRHDYMVNLLENKQYFEAMKHGIKGYFVIDPVLFPYKHHPLRVVHKWTLAMLFIYLASDEQAEAQKQLEENEISVAVIIWSLVSEVNGGVGFSHGSTSSFAKEVQMRLQEVQGQLVGHDAERLRQLRVESGLHMNNLKKLASSE